MSLHGMGVTVKGSFFGCKLDSVISNKNITVTKINIIITKIQD